MTGDTIAVTDDRAQDRLGAPDGDTLAGFAAHTRPAELVASAHTGAAPASAGHEVGATPARHGIEIARLSGPSDLTTTRGAA